MKWLPAFFSRQACNVGECAERIMKLKKPIFTTIAIKWQILEFIMNGLLI